MPSHLKISENFSIDLNGHSPYGCSKLAADIYVQDYAHSYGLKTGVFRMSCIYGERQFGVEDQGWVAWFVIAALTGKPLTIFGDGKQVRDVLFVTDLVQVFDKFLCFFVLVKILNISLEQFTLLGKHNLIIFSALNLGSIWINICEKVFVFNFLVNFTI